MNDTIISEEQPVSCPFQTGLKATEANFKIAIPKLFLTTADSARRKFYFSQLRVVPDFFNRDSLLLDFETAEELALKLNYDFGLFFDVDLNLYSPAPLDFPKQDVAGLQIFFKEVNSWSVTSKPTSVVRPPLVFDWIDLEVLETMAQNVEFRHRHTELLAEHMDAYALNYYGVPLSSDLHANRLPASQRAIPYVNSYLFPTLAAEEDSEILERLRIRIAVAPNTKVSFSSRRMLQMMGFAADRRVGQRYVFSNRHSDMYEYFMADVAPNVLQKLEPGKIYVAPAAESFFVLRSIAFTQKEKRSNEHLAQNLKSVLAQLSKDTNIDFGITYGKLTGLFTFQWPNNAKIQVKMIGDADLFQRLGFGLVGEIDKNSQSVKFVAGDKETATKAKVLCFDTGHVVVTCRNTSSNMASVSNNEYLASLMPVGGGYLEMPASEIATVVPPTFEGGDSVSLECRLWKFDDHGQMVPFKWVTGAVVSGVLRGKV